MKFLILLKKASPRVFVWALLVSVLSGVCSTFVIRLIHQYIDSGLVDVQIFFLQFFVAVICFGVFGVLSSYFISVLTQSMVFNLRIELSKKILNASFQKTERKLDQVLPVLTADINFVSASMNRLPPVVTGLATALGCLVYLFYLSWVLTLGCLGIFTVGFLINYLALPFLKKYSEQARNEWDKIHKNFEGIVLGMKELKLNKEHRENYIHSSIEPNCVNEQKYRVREETLYAVSSRIVEVILFLGIGCFIYVIDGLDWITKESFGDYLLVLLFTVAPLATVSGFLKHIKRTQVSLNKIEQIGISLEDEPNDQVLLTTTDWNAATDPIFSLSGVRFSYGNEEHFAIGPLDLAVMQGEIIYVVGGNGSGKTTFIKLLTGLYKATTGVLTLKNQEIHSHQLDHYRKHFAGVFTDYYLFDDLHHIDEQILEEQAQGLLEQLEIAHKVSIVDKKISTTRLSYGQRKRLAMLVSVMEDKEIYIFDEWAANQDPYFKEIFYTKLLPELQQKGKTIVAISHDEKYFPYADRVLKMVEGELAVINSKQDVLSS
ncbi:cyclic peptide export ABC transporter [Reichenbachiella carrageenanivorans]|uniref:Cyclic peptide export ABC transporter n=1 Tax=Reichenbachiella carrageenanivorans TaxID=2979869 RepID=A0ABY6D3C1_9BACT|nr:cyclic peptide export ABC transporter [Reichenbachiella carrageenanivorans]UXX79558.1 cyclic peptide export ABC transporter [Reichenbachiella carrageenanivorans]